MRYPEGETGTDERLNKDEWSKEKEFDRKACKTQPQPCIFFPSMKLNITEGSHSIKTFIDLSKGTIEINLLIICFRQLTFFLNWLNNGKENKMIRLNNIKNEHKKK